MVFTTVSTVAPDNGLPTCDGLDTAEWGVIGAAAVFMCLACYHGIICAARRAWCCWSLVICAFLECLSLLEYAYSLERRPQTALLLAGAFFRWTAPFFAMSFLVQIFGRLAWHSTRSSPRRLVSYWGFLRWNTSVFTVANIMVFAIGLIGSIIVAAAGSNANAIHGGKGVIKAGLLLQLLVLSAFAIVVARFRTVSLSWELAWEDELKRWNWKVLLNIVLASMACILATQLAKIVIYLAKVPLWAFYVCDGASLFFIVAAFAIVHPSTCLPMSMTQLRQESSLLRAGTPLVGMWGKHSQDSSESSQGSSENSQGSG